MQMLLNCTIKSAYSALIYPTAENWCIIGTRCLEMHKCFLFLYSFIIITILNISRQIKSLKEHEIVKNLKIYSLFRHGLL